MSKKRQLCKCGSGKPAKDCCAGAALVHGREAKAAMRLAADEFSVGGRHLEAAGVLEKLAAASPRNPLIWNDLGVAYEAAGEFEKAMAALKRGYRVDPSYPPVLYNLGKFTWDRVTRLGEAGVAGEGELREMLGEAIGYLNANLDRDPENADGHYYLALAYALWGEERKAQGHMTLAIRLREELEAPVGWRLA
jgi:tetratricopeptide (TPR) repeat protein